MCLVLVWVIVDLLVPTTLFNHWMGTFHGLWMMTHFHLGQCSWFSGPFGAALVTTMSELGSYGMVLQPLDPEHMPIKNRTIS